METLHAISTRRSVRQYSAEPVDDAAISKLLQAAMQAPSAHNSQSWSFVVVREKEVLLKLSGVSRWTEMAAHASAAIVVCGDNSDKYWAINGALAAGNILLAAHDMGLGAVWTAVYPEKDRMDYVAGVLSLPESISAVCVIPIGNPAENPPVEKRFDPAKVHREAW